MDYKHLGRSGLTVSRLCLGTMNFGSRTEESDSHEIMDRALAEGVNFFDTANVYGGEAGKGRTEEVVGSWFAQGAERREKTVLATKVYGNMSDWPNDTFLSARNIVRACEASLRRLQTDWIDLYQFHHVDLRSPWDEIWQACETLVAQGKVLYVGSSNHAAWQIAAANEAAARRHFQGLVSEQSHYNLLTRHVELEVLPAAEHYGVGIIPWSPLAGGLLAGVLEKTEGATAQRRAHPEAGGETAPPARAVRGVLPRDRRRPGRRRRGLAAAPEGGDRADHRPAHHGAVRGRPPGAGAGAGRRPAGPPRRDLPGLQGRAHGVRLVTLVHRPGAGPALQQ